MFGIDLSIKILFSMIVLLLLVTSLALLAGWLGRRLRVHRDREHHLNLHHRANFRAFYYLAVESAEPALHFQFLSGNTPLVEVSRLVSVATVKMPVAPSKGSTPQSVAVNRIQPTAVAGKAMDAGKQVSQKAGALSGLMGAVAAILPGDLGKQIGHAAEVEPEIVV